MNARKLFSYNLNRLLDLHGVPAAFHGRVEAFANLVHRPSSTVHRWLKEGGIPDIGILLQLKQLFSCSLDDFFSNSEELLPYNTTKRDIIPKNETCQATFFSDNGSVELDIPSNLFLNQDSPKSIGMVVVRGTEMSPYANPEDRVIFHTDETEIQSGSVFVLRINGQIAIRRLRIRLDQQVDVLCENTLHPPEQAPPTLFKPAAQADATDIGVLGRVIAKINFVN